MIQPPQIRPSGGARPTRRLFGVILHRIDRLARRLPLAWHPPERANRVTRTRRTAARPGRLHRALRRGQRRAAALSHRRARAARWSCCTAMPRPATCGARSCRCSPQRHTVIVPDLRGAGGSAKPETGYDKKTMAVDIHELTCSRWASTASSIVGHDIGLMVAYAYAAQFPQATDRVVLMDAFLPGIGNWKDVWLLRDLWHFHFYGDVPLALVKGRERTYFEHFWNDFAADPKHSVPEADRRHLRQGLRAARRHARRLRVLPQLRARRGGLRPAGQHASFPCRCWSCPARRPAAPSSSSRPGWWRPTSAARWSQGSGHWLMEEAPKTVIPAITDFVG